MDNNKNCKNVEDCSSCSSCSYCYSSVGLRMSERMIFCIGGGSNISSGEGFQKNNRVFNQQVSESEWDAVKSSLPEIKLPVSWCVDKKNMTDDEKENNSSYQQTGGFLRTLSYEQAWKSWWEAASQKDKDAITSINYFDPAIFTRITGIDVKKEKSLSGKKVKVELDGVSYSATID